MSTRDAATAFRRFGFGARPGDLRRIERDPRGFLLEQLKVPAAALLDHPDLEPSHVVFAAAQQAQRAAKAAKDAARATPPAPSAAPMSSPPAPMADAQTMATPGARPSPPPAAPAQKAGAIIRRDALLEEVAARVDRAIATETPLVERLVHFWSNHFCVSAAKGPVRGLAGGYEREAIRPHVLGRFSSMLTAVTRHPAMLIYLDNQLSTGPNSKAGRNRSRGLNENLAREILELHTLGVGGGYSQGDVTAFAAVLTGWSVGQVDQPDTEPGRFHFAPNRHEPGPQTVLAKRYADQGLGTGEAVLADLARHPSTARHIATKLARHFVSETPPAPLVDRLATTFARTGGDLAAVSKVLVESAECWTEPARKIVPPLEYVVSIVRGFGPRPKSGEIARLAAALGQPTWMVPSPKGWPEENNAWMGPAAIRERLRIAEFLARQMDKLVDPRGLAEEILGEALGSDTKSAIARAETREQGFELLMMAPEFLRR